MNVIVNLLDRNSCCSYFKVYFDLYYTIFYYCFLVTKVIKFKAGCKLNEDVDEGTSDTGPKRK